jgi:hypothetical protein
MKNRDAILTEASNGNLAALDFLKAFARRAHWVDDLCDRDQCWDGPWYAPEKFAQEEADWLTVLTGNPFFLAHRAQLVPSMVLALSAWADSHKFSAGQESVLKGQWHEVVWLVAWLTGGWEAMRQACANREYSVDVPIGVNKPGYSTMFYDGKTVCRHQPLGPMCGECLAKDAAAADKEGANGALR